MKNIICVTLALSSIAAITVSRLSAQEAAGAPVAQQQVLHYRLPWDGNPDEALRLAAAGTTVQMFSHTVSSSRGGSYTINLVGSNPWASPLTVARLPLVIVPLKITIGTTVFNAGAVDSCSPTLTPVGRFINSPLIQASSAQVFNGVSMGNTQYIDGFRKAEFWNLIKSSPAAYGNVFGYRIAATQALTAPGGSSIVGSGCSMYGKVDINWLGNQLRNTVIPALTNAGTINPTQLVVFITKNVAMTISQAGQVLCCALGFHSATGTTPQTYAVVDWDTTGGFPGATGGTVASHELAEWIDDPLTTNPTPTWGNIGQVSGCENGGPAFPFPQLENGDPLTGHNVTVGSTSLQELAFFSWFYNAPTDPSIGAGGKYSSNGTFSGPAKPCPSGGTY